METGTTLKQDKTELTIINDIRILENPSSKVEKDNFFDYPNKVSDSFVICCLQNSYWLYLVLIKHISKDERKEQDCVADSRV